VLVIVTRYFGGTKLGVGGLARAYGDAAEQALREAGERICYLTEPCTVRFAHAHTAAVMRIVSQLHARIVETKYDEQVLMTLEIRRSLAARLRDELTGALRGQVEFDPV
jgi:putative IMPACT (imprinted ancient) family translation regulator